MQIVRPVVSGISKMNLLTNKRDIRPQILPQTVTRLNGEQLVISFPRGWRPERHPKKVTVSSPTDEANAEVAGFRGFKSLAQFENWLFSQAHRRYRQVGSALMYVPTRQVGIGRRLAVNKLDIVIREYEYGIKRQYLGIAGVSLRDISVSVMFEATWSAIAENRRIFENSVKSVRFIPKNLL